MSALKPGILYYAESLPEHWIAVDDTGEVVQWEARARGWDDRVLCRVPRNEIRRSMGVWAALSTGWPHAKRPVGRPPRVNTAPLHIEIDADTLADLKSEAAEADETLTAYVERILEHR